MVVALIVQGLEHVRRRPPPVMWCLVDNAGPDVSAGKARWYCSILEDLFAIVRHHSKVPNSHHASLRLYIPVQSRRHVNLATPRCVAIMKGKVSQQRQRVVLRQLHYDNSVIRNDEASHFMGYSWDIHGHVSRYEVVVAHL